MSMPDAKPEKRLPVVDKYENDAEFVIQGSVVRDDYTSEISKYIRKKIPESNLFLFDGNVRK